jgi:hypothetical protein
MAFSEAALAMYVVGTVEEDVVMPSLHDLVVDRVDDRRYRHVVLRKQRRATKYLMPVIYAKSRDRLGSRTAEAVESLLSGRSLWATERPPYRYMDLWHFCQLYGYEDHDLDPERILDRSSLRHPLDVVDATRDDAYAMTHDLLYYHNLGVDHPAFPDGPAPYDVADVLTGLLLRFLAAEDADVVVELLLAGVLQRQLPADVVRLAASWLVERTDEDGRLPGVSVDGIGYGADLSQYTRMDLASLDDAEKEWLRCYHTTLLWSVTTRAVTREWSSQPEPPDTGWLDRGTNARDTLGIGDLLDALSDYDLVGGARTIRRVGRTDAADRFSPQFGAAVDFLRRQETQDGTFGYWTDEAAVYASSGHDLAEFRTAVVEPVTAACRDALDAVEDERRDP